MLLLWLQQKPCIKISTVIKSGAHLCLPIYSPRTQCGYLYKSTLWIQTGQSGFFLCRSLSLCSIVILSTCMFALVFSSYCHHNGISIECAHAVCVYVLFIFSCFWLKIVSKAVLRKSGNWCSEQSPSPQRWSLIHLFQCVFQECSDECKRMSKKTC